MNLGFRDAALQRLFNERRRLVAKYGERGAQVIACRMMVLQAAPDLECLPTEPPIALRTTAQADVFTIDLEAGRRLAFAVDLPRYDQQGVLVRLAATRLDILGVLT